MMKLNLTVFLALLVAISACAMIETLPFPQLVKSAEFILIAKVTATAPAKEGFIKNTLTVEKSLKGEWATDEPLELTAADAKKMAFEDMITLPEGNQRILLFLKKGTDGSLLFVNGIQGVWPLEEKTDRTLGMGFKYSLAQVEAEVKGAK